MQKGFVPIIILVGILVLASVGGAYYFFKVKPPVQKACTMDAKICPDGSGVGRSGPNCEFSPCSSPKPTNTPDASREPAGSAETANWKVNQRILEGGIQISFKYPINWSEDLAFCPSLPAEQKNIGGVLSDCVKTDFLGRSGAKDVINYQAKVEMVSINGYKVFKNIDLVPMDGSGPIYTVVFFDSSNEPLAGIISYIGAGTDKEKVDSLIKTLDQIVTTFKFLDK